MYMSEELICLECDECHGQLFLLDAADQRIVCDGCGTPQANIVWDWTADEEEYVELELEDGSKYVVS